MIFDASYLVIGAAFIALAAWRAGRTWAGRGPTLFLYVAGRYACIPLGVSGAIRDGLSATGHAPTWWLAAIAGIVVSLTLGRFVSWVSMGTVSL